MLADARQDPRAAAQEVEVLTPRRPRLLPVAVALCVHGLLLLGLGRRIPQLETQRRIDAEDVAVQLTVVRLPSPTPPIAAPEPVQKAKASARDTEAPSPDTPPHVLSQPAPTGPTAPPAETVPDAGHLQNALRGLVGCAAPAAYGLTADQRAACNRHYAEPAPVYAQLDPKEQAAFDADSENTPLLVRKPKNGCLPRAGNRPSAASQSGRSASMAATTTGGVGCAWAF